RKTNILFAIHLPSGALTFPAQPLTIPADASFFWPFNFDLGKSVTLDWATAQPLSAIDVGDTRTVFFAETKGVPAQFAFDSSLNITVISGKTTRDNGQIIVSHAHPGASAAVQIQTDDGTVQIVLLSDAQSLGFWKDGWQGRDRVFLTGAGLAADGDELRLTSTDRAALNVAVYPAPAAITLDGRKLRGKSRGIFTAFTRLEPEKESFHVALEPIQPAGPPRVIPMGNIRDAVAAAPDDADFKQAAIWRIKLPGNFDLTTDPLLRLSYVGDVARVTLNGKLLTDNFYNGTIFEVGLRRYAPEILTGDLQVEILPLRKDAPIMLAKQARPDFGNKESIAALDRVEIVPRYQVELTAR
ncbi:MAG TPA: hypothetical protein VMH30_10680, partial [Verrucomicrobiae bacterium]|nr:hypothetical protein [Verrucomicrobiae bacterium]